MSSVADLNAGAPLTVLFLTANKLPARWAEFQRATLIAAAGDCPIITIARERALDWGSLNLLDAEPQTISNIYFQMLRGAREASTPFVAVAEDDTLYCPDHFRSFRPDPDAFAYNRNRLGVFTWGRATYFWKDRQSNSTLVAPRALLIEALEERFAKHPRGTPKGLTGELGRPNIDRALGLTPRRSVWFETELSVVRVDHPFGIDTLAVSRRKAMGIMRSYDIPHWGRARDVVERFK